MVMDAGITTPPGTRRWRRFQFTLPVRVAVEKFRQTVVVSSRGSQVNAGGLAFFVSTDVDTDVCIGDEAEIAFTDYDLTVRGVVRNRASQLCGVKFLATSAEAAEQLALFRQMLSSKVGRLDA
ncbi:MAG TPA: PilZ domain-containing protein [Terriglobales bacterium]|nr:PilZ domain-containing protein [Terriglobales bacterium]